MKVKAVFITLPDMFCYNPAIVLIIVIELDDCGESLLTKPTRFVRYKSKWRGEGRA